MATILINLSYSNGADIVLDLIGHDIQIGDRAYTADLASTDGVLTSEPELIGKIIDITSKGVRVQTIGSIMPVAGQFFLFSKNIQVEESSLKGYFANVEFKNESKKLAELFAISSEVSPSSK